MISICLLLFLARDDRASQNSIQPSPCLSLAEWLGLPVAPPYMQVQWTYDYLTTGVNYASGSAGILTETGSALGRNLFLDAQINYFQDTIREKVGLHGAKLANYLSKSIFVVTIGSNDYMNYYLQPEKYPSSKKYTPQQFADHLVTNLVQRLKILYGLGGRKFVVFNIGRIGCAPGLVPRVNGRPISPCDEAVNQWVLYYNSRYPIAIQELERNLTGSNFVRADIYKMNKTSAEAGFAQVQSSCCEVGRDGMCLPNLNPCPDRTAHQFYDAFHPTEVVNRAFAEDCFDGFDSCKPINVQQLVQQYSKKQ